MDTKKPSLTSSIGTKLTPEQHAAVKAKAAAQGVDVSEYIRQTLLSALQAATTNTIEPLLRAQLEETQALRILLVNLAALKANGTPLTPELLEKVRERADALKAERAQALLAATNNNQSQLASTHERKEAA